MLLEIILFCSCFFLGCVSRFLYKSLKLTRSKMGIAAAFTLQFLSVGIISAAFIAIMLIIGGGIFMPFTLIAVVVGFMAVSLFF